MDPTAAPLVLERAFELFCRQGYSATTVRQVAEAAGVSPGVVTYHYPKKDELFRACLQGPYSRFVAALQARVEAADRSPAARLRDVIDLVSAPGEETSRLLRMMLRQLLDSVEPLQGLAPVVARGHVALISRAIFEAAEAGALPPGVGVGALPIIFGGAVVPRLLAEAVRGEPAAEELVKAVTAESKRNLLMLLGLAP